MAIQQTKVSEEELKEIENFQQSVNLITYQLGQIALQRLSLELRNCLKVFIIQETLIQMVTIRIAQDRHLFLSFLPLLDQHLDKDSFLGGRRGC